MTCTEPCLYAVDMTDNYPDFPGVEPFDAVRSVEDERFGTPDVGVSALRAQPISGVTLGAKALQIRAEKTGHGLGIGPGHWTPLRRVAQATTGARTAAAGTEILGDEKIHLVAAYVLSLSADRADEPAE